jgi:5'-3' exonuclease, N-terminal resolvase-like domain
VTAVAGDGHDELFQIDGNSLAYGAFFALPESIATSTGFPTNTTFGFASMLVKLLTQYGPKPTIVVWDAGTSGRKEVSGEYKATRRSRSRRWSAGCGRADDEPRARREGRGGACARGQAGCPGRAAAGARDSQRRWRDDGLAELHWSEGNRWFVLTTTMNRSRERRAEMFAAARSLR